jgi:two-component system response regulator HydG
MVVMVTGHGSIESAVESMKQGAFDYVVKPCSMDQIEMIVKKAEEYAQLVKVNQYFSDELLQASQLLGESQAMRSLKALIQKVAVTSATVLVTGENGTGKEVVASELYRLSSLHGKPYVRVNCAAIPENLIESEFFGHEKGSFTGALFTKIGHFEMANGGTLFLDEVGNLSYDIQAALLRTVQERKVKRIGSTKEIDLDVRIIVATNENLAEAIQKGRFREDLYHRFNEFSINLPPLSKRGSDIMIFANTFLQETNQELGKQVKSFSKEVEECFLTYNWPGNVRELKNVVRRATLLTESDEILLKALPLEISTYAKAAIIESAVEHTILRATQITKPRDLKNAALEAEYEAILNVLREVNFNKTKAAQILNIDRKTLYNKMKSINLDS